MAKVKIKKKNIGRWIRFLEMHGFFQRCNKWITISTLNKKIYIYIKLCIIILILLYWYLKSIMAFLVAQTIKNPPAIQKNWVWSLGQEDPLEEEIENHSSIPA